MLSYGAQSSAKNEDNFSRREISEQLRAGHVAILPWEEVKHLSGLRLYLIAAIPLVGRKLHLIYDFSWSVLDANETQAAQNEGIRVVRSLHCLIN